jgi:acetyl-CoA carboxylase carboxyl transferase subunit alpha
MSTTTTSGALAPAAVSGTHFLDFEKPLMRMQAEIAELEAQRNGDGEEFATDIRELRTKLSQMTKRMYSHLTAWETVMVARHPQRPLAPDYIQMIVRDFCEIHGDRLYGDDRALITGFGRIGRTR